MSKAKRRELEVVPTSVTSKNDKRLFDRFVMNQVSVRYKDLRLGEKGTAVCRDISGSGAGLDCSQELRAKTPLELWFDFTDGFEPMHLLGKVHWLRPEGTSWRIGVAFDKPRMMSLSRILKTDESQPK